MGKIINIKKRVRVLKDAKVIIIDPETLSLPQLRCDVRVDLDGDWDTLGRSVKNGYIFKSFKMRLGGEAWEDTPIYKNRPISKPSWIKKLRRWDRMIADIVENGYTFRPLKKDFIDEYMSILIGRNGDMFIYNGIHRLCCCLLSKVKKEVPVKVLLRHSGWKDFRANVTRYQKKRGQLYCQLPHPDLASIPYYWTNERAELIAENSINQGGYVLDAGSHWGTTSYVLAQKGFNCTAAEISKSHHKRAVKIARFPGKWFMPINRDFLDLDINLSGTLVLLNIAHHFIYKPKLFKKFKRFLRTNPIKEIFYQAHKLGDKWSPKMEPLEMLKTISSRSNLSTINELGNFNGRILYHLK